jgi:hypothetical protein
MPRHPIFQEMHFRMVNGYLVMDFDPVKKKKPLKKKKFALLNPKKNPLKKRSKVKVRNSLKSVKPWKKR